MANPQPASNEAAPTVPFAPFGAFPSTPFNFDPASMTAPWKQFTQMLGTAGKPGGQAAQDWLAKLIEPTKLATIQADYVRELGELMQSGFAQQKTEADAKVKSIGDRRFQAPEWQDGGMFEFLSRVYMLNARVLTRLAEAVEAEPRVKRRITFAVGQWIDAMSPANFLVTNPEAQRKLVETRGESLRSGIANLLEDVSKGRISMTDESKFEVGRNVATTEGQVVLRTDMFELIQYKPLTAEIDKQPLLMVPPCINKFYILDLQPDNSIVRYMLSQGHPVYMVSWRNPTQECGNWSWDDYIERGVIAAIEATAKIGAELTDAKKINVLGFCVGGTLTATAIAVLAARGKHPVASLTLLTTLLDFSDTGVLDVFIDPAIVALREERIGKGGLLSASELATTFSFLRPNDLVWPYVVGNYLKGETPAAFDLLYWNSDSTNLSGPMYCWYLRNTYLENKLKIPGETSVCGTPLDLGRVDLPVYFYGSREDHIVPWESAYQSMAVLPNADKAKSCFVLGASGHIAGVINPASKNKRNYWAYDGEGFGGKARKSALPATPQEWIDGATSVPGSWWPHWSKWLDQFSGGKVAAPAEAGSPGFPALEPAPGSYVKVRVV
ncbi:class I poly(R)-hydroxyalkanoic acid synthase [Derxia gummosa]|uniref:Class I poly(R)-hydroxyalkanoic acid synthase n=1 Tax=Derxia gummosa DSM 723 TaxID=1121388 RepID=A0A8B6XB58_9BURK|nr:class I poly(R)-hydroxyalkanoic acid synthase [Derxia gummosa]